MCQAKNSNSNIRIQIALTNYSAIIHVHGVPGHLILLSSLVYSFLKECTKYLIWGLLWFLLTHLFIVCLFVLRMASFTSITIRMNKWLQMKHIGSCRQIKKNKNLHFASEHRDAVGGSCWGCMLNWSLINDTGSLWTTECHNTAFFTQRERTQALSQTHTQTQCSLKSADLSGSTRRCSVCDATEPLSCDNAANDTPHPRVTRTELGLKAVVYRHKPGQEYIINHRADHYKDIVFTYRK